jgi:formate hydrogenlyase subunit 3/multisubunit Na+/H+ antiporter MnhD subunit
LERHQGAPQSIFFALFLVQQTAMFGVFVSLDLMLYYGFWELSLVPMAILIAMYGRKDGPKAALKFFLFTFIPSAPLLVAILWLYARPAPSTSRAANPDRQRPFPAGALFWVALAFLFAFAVKVPVFPLHGWLSDTFSEAPVALAMVVAGKLGLYSMLRFHIGLFPVQARAAAPYLIALAVIGILYGACLALVQRDFWKLIAFAAVSHLSLIVLGIYGFTFIGSTGAVYQILSHGVVDGALFCPARRALRPLRDQPDQQPTAAWPQTAAHRHALRPHHAGHDRPAHAQRLCRRVPDPLQHLWRRQPRLGCCRLAGRDSRRGLHAVAGAAHLLRPAERDGRLKPCRRSALPRTGRAVPHRALTLVMGVAPSIWLQRHQAGRTLRQLAKPSLQAMTIRHHLHCQPSGRASGESSARHLPHPSRGHPHAHRRSRDADRRLAPPGVPRRNLGWVAAIGTTLALWASLWQLSLPQGTGFFGTVETSAFTIFFHVLICGIVLVALLLSLDTLPEDSHHQGEYYALIVFGAVGMCLLTGAVELLVVFIALEISSIATYVLAGYRKQTARGPKRPSNIFCSAPLPPRSFSTESR